MTVFAGDLTLNAKQPNINALPHNGSGGVIHIAADELTSHQLLAPHSKVIIDAKHKAQLVGLHAANILGFKGVEIELLGAFEFHSELGFLQKGQHCVDALGSAMRNFIKRSAHLQKINFGFRCLRAISEISRTIFF